MANKRGRGRSEFGQMFSPYMVSGSFTPVSAGQPFVHRLFGIPTAVGFRGRWNLILPFLALVEMLYRWRS
ncbi:MAG TPA: hypothetical protein VI729_10275 [Anaerolineales bacterium]|nr:hypothetical protein [Anaerolineales bacterium]